MRSFFTLRTAVLSLVVLVTFSLLYQVAATKRNDPSASRKTLSAGKTQLILILREAQLDFFQVSKPPGETWASAANFPIRVVFDDDAGLDDVFGATVTITIDKKQPLPRGFSTTVAVTAVASGGLPLNASDEMQRAFIAIDRAIESGKYSLNVGTAKIELVRDDSTQELCAKISPL